MYYHFPHSNAQHSKVLDHKLNLLLEYLKNGIVEVLQLCALFFSVSLFSLLFSCKNELPFMFRYFLLSFFVAFSSHMNELFSFQKYKLFTKKKTKLLVHSRQRAKKIGFTAMLAKITANFSRRFCESTRLQIFFFAYTI